MSLPIASVVRLDEISQWGAVQYVGLLLSVAIAALNLWVGYVTDTVPILAVGCSFLFGVVLFFTRFWRPVLYLVGVLHVAVLGVIWVLAGMEPFLSGVLNGVLSLGLAAIALWLFVDDQRAVGE